MNLSVSKSAKLGLFLSLINLPSSMAEDWVQWRGPNQNGISLEKNFNSKKISKSAKSLWTSKLGKGHSAVSVEDGKCYTKGNLGNKDIIYCIDTKTGSTLWKTDYPCKAGSFPGPRATPILDGDYLYTVSRDGLVLCLEKKNGNKVWQKHLLKEKLTQNPKWGFASSILIEGDMALLNAGSHGIALNKKNGNIIWKSRPEAGGYATPLVFEHKGNKMAAIYSKDKIVIVDVKSGTPYSEYPWETKHGVNAAVPIVIGDQIFISSAYGKGSTLLNITKGKLTKVWYSDQIQNHISNWIYKDGYLYGTSGKAKTANLVCVEFKSGKIMWEGIQGAESMLATSDDLIVLDKKGKLHIAPISPKACNPKQTLQVFNARNSTYWTMPIISDGKLFVRDSTGSLVCYDVSS